MIKILFFVSMFASWALFFASIPEAGSASESHEGISYGYGTLKVSDEHYLYVGMVHGQSVFVDKTDGSLLVIPHGLRYKVLLGGQGEHLFTIVPNNNLSLITDNPGYRWHIMNGTEYVRGEIAVGWVKDERTDNLSSKVLMRDDLLRGSLFLSNSTACIRLYDEIDYHRFLLADGNESCWSTDVRITYDGLVIFGYLNGERFLPNKKGSDRFTECYDDIVVVDGEVYGRKGPVVTALGKL